MRHTTGFFHRFLIAVLVLLMAAGAAACGDDGDNESSATGDGEVAASGGASADEEPAGDDGGASADEEPAGDDGGAEPQDPLAPQPLDEPYTLRIAARSWIESFAPVIVGDAMGEFAKENLELEYTEVPSSEITVLLATGRLDVGAVGITAGFMNAVAGGVPLKVVLPNHVPNPESKSGLWVTDEFAGDETDPVELTKRLEGEEIGSAVGAGSVIAWVIDEVLQDAGLSISDISLKKIGGGPETLIAFEQNAVAGAWVLDPFWVELEDAGTAVFVAPQPPGKALGGYLMGDSMLIDRPEVAEAFVRAMTRTVRSYLQGDYHQEDDVIAALEERTGQTPEDIRNGLPLVFDPEMTLLTEEDMASLQAVFRQADVLDYEDDLPYSDLIETSLVDQVAG